MCGPSNNTTVTSTGLPPAIDASLQSLLSKGVAASNQPYTPYKQPRIAPFSPDQSAGFQDTRNAVGSFQPDLNQATQLAQNAGNTNLTGNLQSFGAPQLAQYGNPYTQGVIDSTNQEIQRQAGIGNQQIAGQAAQAGAYGGDRATIAQEENQRNALNTIARNTAGLNSANFTQAQGQFNTEQNRGLAAQEGQAGLQANAAGQLSALGAQQQGLGLQGAGALQGIGAQQQALGQQGLNTAYGDFLNQQFFPQAQANFLSGIIHGFPTNDYRQTQTTTPGPSPVSQLAGLGLAAGSLGQAGAFNGLGGALGKAASGLGGALGSAASSIGSGLGSAASYIGDAASSAGDYLSGLFDDGGRVGFARGGGVRGYADGGGTDDYSPPPDDSTPTSDAAPAAAYGGDNLSGMSDQQLIDLNRNGSDLYPPALVQQEISNRGIHSPAGYLARRIATTIGNANARANAENVDDPEATAGYSRVATTIGDANARANAENVDNPEANPLASGLYDWMFGDQPRPTASTSGISSGWSPVAAAQAAPQVAAQAPTNDAAAAVLDPNTPADTKSAILRGAIGAKMQPDRRPGAPLDTGSPPPDDAMFARALLPKPTPPAGGIAGQPARPGAQPQPGIGGAEVQADRRVIGQQAGIAPRVAPPAPNQAADTSGDWLQNMSPSSLALLNAGLGMMASNSSHPLQAIGEGAQHGVQTLVQQRQIAATNALKQAQMGMQHDYQMGRLGEMQGRTQEMAYWHQQQIAAQAEAHRATNETQRQNAIDRAQSARDRLAILQQNADSRQQAADSRPTAESRAAETQVHRDNLAREAYASIAKPDATGQVDPANVDAGERHLMEMYPDSTQGKAVAARRYAQIPDKSFQRLREDPKLAVWFDKQFGPGLAKRALAEQP